MEVPRPYFKGINRYTYLQDPAINPLLNRLPDTKPKIAVDREATAHRYLSDMYQALYEAGNRQAIFEYGRADFMALRAPWVVQQIETWLLENTEESDNNLQTFWKYYTSKGKGKRLLSTQYAIIKSDIEMVKAVIRLNKLKSPKTQLLRSRRHDPGCFVIVAKSHGNSRDEVRRIYLFYKSQIDYFMGKLTRADLRRYQLLKEKGLISPDQKPIPPSRLLSSWGEVIEWLDDMAAALERAVNMGDEEPDS